MSTARARVAAIAGVLVAASQQLPAQSVGKMLESDFRNFGGDLWAVWTSPVHAHGRDWLIAGSTVALSGLVSIWDDDVDRWMVEHRDASQWSALKEVREGGIAFSGKTITPIALGALAIGLITKNQAIQDGIFGCIASYVSGSVVRNQVAYRLIARRRPAPEKGSPEPPAADSDDQYDIELPGQSDWGQHSLPAGHAANVLACASFLNHRFAMGVIEPALYVVSTGVGVGRLVDRRHWTSDTMLGMVFGYAIGKEVAKRSSARVAKRAMAPSVSTSSFYITPAGGGISAGWRATF